MSGGLLQGCAVTVAPTTSSIALALLLFAAWLPLWAGTETPFQPIITRSVAANRIAERPEYAHELGEELRGLSFGLESRTRYERRWSDYGDADLISDDALVTRNLFFFAVSGGLDPLRLGMELQDSRRFFSERETNPNLENSLEPLQAYAQLHFDEVLGGAPLSLTAGRMVFDLADRRLIARNRNRNTINSFDGLRLRLGDENHPWEVEALALRPVTRNPDNVDHSSSDQSLYGLTGYFRGLGSGLVLEPYWLWLDQRRADQLADQRNLHSFGLHAFGQWGEANAWDYDLSVVGQWGESRGLDHSAWAAHAELGRTFTHAWKPRLALWLNYASGDRDPGDGSSERFDPLFGATYAFYSYQSYFIWQNMINPALRLSFAPVKPLRCELMYRVNRLASDRDLWPRGSTRQDASGASGGFVGHELDLRLVWQVCKNFDLDLAYGHFFPGGFAKGTGSAPQSEFVQIAGTLRF